MLKSSFFSLSSFALPFLFLLFYIAWILKDTSVIRLIIIWNSEEYKMVTK